MGEKKGTFMQKVQRFGGAMFTPVLFFAVFGIIVGFATLFKNELVFGAIAHPDTTWYKFWDLIYMGANTVFKQMPLLFAIGLPVSLAKKQQARACLETFVIYVTFLYLTSTMLQYWGTSFGVDFESTARTSGLATVASVKTLDMGIIGALLVAGIAVYLHNRFFDLELPKYVETFNGSPFVVLVGFFTMIPVALAACLIWPHVQRLIASLQQFLASTGVLGVGIYTFMERLMIPFGLHHFIYAPFLYDAAIVDGGVKAYWVAHLSEFAAAQGFPCKHLPRRRLCSDRYEQDVRASGDLRGDLFDGKAKQEKEGADHPGPGIYHGDVHRYHGAAGIYLSFHRAGPVCVPCGLSRTDVGDHLCLRHQRGFQPWVDPERFLELASPLELPWGQLYLADRDRSGLLRDLFCPVPFPDPKAAIGDARARSRRCREQAL